MKFIYASLIVLIFLATSGCAGFRSGFASIPYVGEAEPAPETPAQIYELSDLQDVQLPGVKLHVSINNTIRTRDIAVMLLVVPISVDLKDTPSFKDTDRFTVGLTIIPADSGFIFDPSGVVAAVDGQSFSPKITRLEDTEKRIAFWKSSSGTLKDLDKLSNVIDTERLLIKDKFYTFDLTFDCPVPTPDRTITLDIGKALVHPQHPAAPTIRFKKIRWKQGYT